MSEFLRTTALSGIYFALMSTYVSAGDMHPDVPLLDTAGQPVIETGMPMSTMMSCGGECHDTDFIMSGSDHADAGASRLGQGRNLAEWAQGPGYFGGWNPLSYDIDGLGGTAGMERQAWLKRYGARHVGGGPVSDLVEMNCLLCHTGVNDHSARESALEDGDFEWANSASLSSLGIITRQDGGWKWNDSYFQENGALRKGLLNIRKARDENCAQCHGIADNSLDDPLIIPPKERQRHSTQRTGQLISPQKIVNSGLNIAGKEALTYPFDVHADRVVGCVNCHYSLNNPVYFRQREESRPAHLAFDPRRMTVSDYLSRPSHQFAKGNSTAGLATETVNSLRRCESCHEAEAAHDWLPYKQRHFTALACESCHITKLYGPGLETIDWTMLDGSGEPIRQYRGTEGDPLAVDKLTDGFHPVLLPRESMDGEIRLAPFNLVTSWYWTAGEPAMPVTREQLATALLGDGAHHPAMVEALDTDNDGLVSGRELSLQSESAMNAVRQRLEAAGLQGPQVRGDIIPFPINHNVVNGDRATRDCRSCHGSDSLMAAPFELSRHPPAGILPFARPGAGAEFSGEISRSESGELAFVPDINQAGFYVIGLHGQKWVDLLGLAMFFGVIVGVSGHALARYLFSRRRASAQRQYDRVYMYDAYERLWHWLQAGTILLLLFTGLMIHKPGLFGIFSFPYLVTVHNVLGFIVLINAALALFYNLASGEIRQYLPEPRGFIARSVKQALYYSKGIFAGEPHPLEKSREHKLNPLQQITYLGVLNILLPLQVITGVLIWGLQEWPAIADSLGGFEILATLHTLVAWTFAAFIVMHVYLTTAAGHTPGAGIKSMIEGWDDVERHDGAFAPEAPKEI